MNLRDLKYLLALYEYQHFRKAAEACFVSQPGLSMQIKKLEEELGVTLIERHTQKIWFTPIGKKIVHYAKEMIAMERMIKETAKTAHDPEAGEIHLGLIPTIAPYLLPMLMPILHLHLPKLHVYLQEEKTHILLDQLADGTLDVAIIALPFHTSGFVILPLFEETLKLVVNKHHPLAQHQSKIDMKLLKTYPLILLEKDHCLRDHILTLCQLPANPNTFHATSLETLRYMVASNLGISLFPEMACSEHIDLCYLSFHDPVPKRTIALLYRPTTSHKNILKKIALYMKPEFMQNSELG